MEQKEPLKVTSDRVDEILDEWKRDKREGRNPSLQDYLRRYPQYQRELALEIASLEFVSEFLSIVESERGFTEEEVKASLERSRQRIAQEWAKLPGQ